MAEGGYLDDCYERRRPDRLAILPRIEPKMQLSSPIPDFDAVGVADLVARTPQQPDPLEDLYAAAAVRAGPSQASQLAELAELAGIVAAMRAAARAERTDDGDGRYTAPRLSLARAPQVPVDGQTCAVLAVDIAGFTRADRDDDIRRYLRERLYTYLQQAFDRSGVPWAECFCEDRGDGALIVVPPEIPAKGLIGPLPDKLRHLVRLHNHVSAPAADMQLRIAAHIGPVEHDGRGFVGTDVNFAFRMLEARALKTQLAKSGAELGLIVSDYVYDSFIRRYPVLVDPGVFRTVRFQTKNTRARAWTYLPGAAA